MTDWWIGHSAKVAIGVLVVAALGYGGVIVHNTGRIPELEQASLKQARDIAYLKATMVTLMQQTGHPPTMGDLERLLSSVGEFGARTAPFVKSAHLVITGEPLAYYHWVPPRVQDSLQRHLGPYDMAFSSSNTPTMTTDRPQV